MADLDELRARLEFGVITRDQLRAAAFAGDAAARALLADAAQVTDDAVAMRAGGVLNGRIVAETGVELILEPGRRVVRQTDVLRVARGVPRWSGESAEPAVWYADLLVLGRPLLTRAVVAAARLVLPHHQADRPDDVTAIDAIAAAQRWLDGATQAREEAARDAAARVHESFRRSGPSPGQGRRMLEAARAQGLDVSELEGLELVHWYSVLEGQLSSLPPAREGAWLAAADAALCAGFAAWPGRPGFAGPFDTAVQVAGVTEVRRAVDAALLTWALG